MFTVAHATPRIAGADVVVAHALPHLPSQSRLTVTLDGRTVASFLAWEGKATLRAADIPVGPHTLTLAATDPQVRGRLLYTRSIPLQSDQSPAGAAAKPPYQIVFGLDGVAWDSAVQEGPGAQEPWDRSATSDRLRSLDLPAGDVKARVTLGAGGTAQTTAAAGRKDIRAVLTLRNETNAPVRVLAAGLRLTGAGGDATPRFFILPLAALPAVIAPGAQAEQAFRIDCFDDTPSGECRVVPAVVYAAAEADLLADGGFETARALPKAAEGAPGWAISGSAPEGLHAAVTPSSAPYSDLAAQIADWTDFGKLSFSNSRHIASQGQGLLEVAFPAAPAGLTAVAEQSVAALHGGETYLVGADAWSGADVRVELFDKAGNDVAGQDRNFSGFWWTESAATWRSRVFALKAPPSADHAKVSLLAAAQTSWYDNCFLVSQSAARRAVAQPATLTVAPAGAGVRRPVVYLGEDRDTKGTWLGNYGSYCWMLCAMSAPREMVGGEVKALKCHHDDMTKAYANETIRVRGTGEFRYCSWTGNPNDVLTRHWIGVMRTEEERALENPQWGYRTYASWDDHGETHPTDAGGPDLWVKLRMPSGLWQVSLYFVDWDWFAAPFPRAHRMAFLDEAGREICTARVADFGQGVYKRFGVEGGRDVVFRIRKDFSATVVLSGIFLDRLEKLEPTRTFREEQAAFHERAVGLAGKGSKATWEPLVALGDEAFKQGDLRHAELAYDEALALQAKKLTGLDLADATLTRAKQFRVEHSLYALTKCREALAVVDKLPAQPATDWLRRNATELVALAGKDWTEGKGLVRLGYVLPTEVYQRLLARCGYGSLTREDQENMVLCLERQTWYDMGFEDLAAGLERLIASIPEEQVTGALLLRLLRAYAVVAQKDARAIPKAEALVERMRGKLPDGDYTLSAVHRMAQIYYHEGRNEQAKKLCEEIIAKWPNGPEAKECQRILDMMKPAK